MYDWVIPTLVTLTINVFLWFGAFWHIRAKERERERSERHLLIHERLFEVEFIAMKEIWDSVDEVSSRFASLRLQALREGDDGSSVSLEGDRQLIKSYGKLSAASAKNEPFLDQSIFKMADCILDALFVLIERKNPSDGSPALEEMYEKAAPLFFEYKEILVSLIRERTTLPSTK